MNVLQSLLKELPFSTAELLSIISTAPYRYKVYKIAKREPGAFRTIAQPTPEVKLIQRWLVKNVFSELPVHTAATAYREGLSIADHARKHSKKRFLLKMDFKNFFPSITENDVSYHLVTMLGLSGADADIVSKLVCWRDRTQSKNCLSIGAPSSPSLSNSILYQFDLAATVVAKTNSAIYSRYADDLAFSTDKKGVLISIESEIRSVCDKLRYPKLAVNKSKTVFTSRANGRFLVGLNLTTEGGISVGRERKRRIRSLLYRISNNSSIDCDLAMLRGELSFIWSVEPEFIMSMVRQFGVDIFRKLDLPFGMDR
ncbi:retron St85 family RNA-directed DNA polymerase [Nevskia sp.]|uniref:retron St85 family RNA-directed DNA polymerase n=1 Tax=Nevskia sp. TaxID=1929292 RepID=UPI0025EEF7B6|nr:retron St85 family RNA-directed DNA polymerase [Nevskia sp.]